MPWRTNKPNEADRVKNLGGIIRDNKLAFDTAVQKCFYWSDSESSAGIVTSSATTGTARAFYDAASRLSTDNVSINTDGRLFFDSTNTRLYVLDSSEDTTLVGSGQVIVVNYDVGRGSNALASNKRILVQSGSVTGVGPGATVGVSYTTTYTATPSLMITPTVVTPGDASKGSMYVAYLENQNLGDFSVGLSWQSSAADPDAGGFHWRAEGEVDV